MRSIFRLQSVFLVLLMGLLIACGPGPDDGGGTTDPPPPPPVKSLQAHLYLESSGSMFPYEADAGGDFNNAVQQVIGAFHNLPPNKARLYTVNDKVYPLNVDLPTFIATNNLFSLTKGKGTPNTTNFRGIFNHLLDSLRQGQVAILVSDLIYSDASTNKVSAKEAMANIRDLMDETFSRHADKSSVLVVKMNADFKGPYYARNGKFTHNGPRPYYLVFISDKTTMQRLLTEEKLAPLRRFADLPGYEAQHYFGPSLTPRYSVLEKDPNQVGDFDQSSTEVGRGQEGIIHAIENVETNPDTRQITIAVGVNLSGLPLDASYLTNPASYQVSSPDGFKVTKVQLKPETAPGYTHRILLTTKQGISSGKHEVKIALRRQFPPTWITRTGTDNDSQNNPNFSNTTFGFTALMQGVENAYNKSQTPTYFTLTLQID
ncbi:MAG: hypothetical protein LH606_16340 [Cytophagaceae bacterium]|nr:hypothetical protein [Cytophagaceae bacterium]